MVGRGGSVGDTLPEATSSRRRLSIVSRLSQGVPGAAAGLKSGAPKGTPGNGQLAPSWVLGALGGRWGGLTINLGLGETWQPAAGQGHPAGTLETPVPL